MSKVYLITYNTDINFNKDIFHNYVNFLFKNDYISDWWHYVDTAYLVASNLDVNQLYNSVFPGVPKRYLLIIEVNVDNAQGWLPKAAWDWIQKYQLKK